MTHSYDARLLIWLQIIFRFIIPNKKKYFVTIRKNAHLIIEWWKTKIEFI